MTKVEAMRPRFVDAIPDTVEAGVLYISEEYATAIHKCCCGCGQEVVTPLGPTDWRVSVAGGVITVYPSIGNWSFPCRSHYWIEEGRIRWAEQWSQARIESGRRYDRIAKQRRYGEMPDTERQQPATGFWARFWRLLRGC